MTLAQLNTIRSEVETDPEYHAFMLSTVESFDTENEFNDAATARWAEWPDHHEQ